MSDIMKVKITALFIAILFSFTALSTAYAAPLFSDVPDTHHQKAELDYLAERGILTADAEVAFGANEEITRLEASKFIVLALELNTENRPIPDLVDVTLEDVNYDIIATVVDEGIMTGNELKEFMPDNKLTRAQMAGILARAFDLTGETSFLFKDVKADHWATDAIKALYVNNITTGFEDHTYRPQSFITKAHFSVFLARILNPEFKKTMACYKPASKKKYAINVVVTNLWAQPNQTRVVDRPSLSIPADMNKWTKSLSIPQKQWLVGKTDTQALYGDEVSLLKTSGNWAQIAVTDQAKANYPKGYPGWVPLSHITEIQKDFSECSIAIVVSKIAPLYNDVDGKSVFMDISYTTVLPVIKEEGQWIHVQTPANGIKYLRKADAKVQKNLASLPKPTQKDIVDNAKRFLGLPYLWAGASAYGFDCSGLMYSVYKNHGILIPRDSFEQAKHGTAVARKDMQAGDLMFFAYQNGKGKVYHVGMYIGDGKMIHAPNSSRKVEIVSIELQPYKKNFSGARRYLNE